MKEASSWRTVETPAFRRIDERRLLRLDSLIISTGA